MVTCPCNKMEGTGTRTEQMDPARATSRQRFSALWDGVMHTQVFAVGTPEHTAHAAMEKFGGHNQSCSSNYLAPESPHQEITCYY